MAFIKAEVLTLSIALSEWTMQPPLKLPALLPVKRLIFIE